jgi:hypothetical protein
MVEIRDFRLEKEKTDMLENAFHALWIGDKIRAQITFIELHAIDYINVGLNGFACFIVVLPSLPICCMALAMIWLISWSPLAETLVTSHILPPSTFFKLCRALQ